MKGAFAYSFVHAQAPDAAPKASDENASRRLILYMAHWVLSTITVVDRPFMTLLARRVWHISLTYKSKKLLE